ncbi:MAG: VWA domain-containing protein, partial [Gammaproteobacteria bacterium]
MKRFIRWLPAAFAAALLAPGWASADSIDPASYADTLEEGESVTIRKTVTIDEGTTSSLIDVIFLIDTSGSMGGEIAAAKTAASDILSGLAGFGNVATGSGYYSDPGYDGLYRSLTTNATTGQQNINDIDLLLGGGGGDFPEKGFAATEQAAEGAAWRPGSNRFIIAFGDANFKESDGSTVDTTIAALNENNVTFVGLNFGSLTSSGFGGIDPTVLSDATDGSIVPASTDPTT